MKNPMLELAIKEGKRPGLPNNSGDMQKRPEVQARREALFAAISDNPGLTRQEITELLKEHPSTVTNDIGWLRGQGRIHHRQRGQYFPGAGE